MRIRVLVYSSDWWWLMAGRSPVWFAHVYPSVVWISTSLSCVCASQHLCGFIDCGQLIYCGHRWASERKVTVVYQLQSDVSMYYKTWHGQISLPTGRKGRSIEPKLVDGLVSEVICGTFFFSSISMWAKKEKKKRKDQYKPSPIAHRL